MIGWTVVKRRDSIHAICMRTCQSRPDLLVSVKRRDVDTVGKVDMVGFQAHMKGHILADPGVTMKESLVTDVRHGGELQRDCEVSQGVAQRDASENGVWF